jgi:hypothetical protein
MLGPALTAALLKLDELGESDSWLKFAMVGRYNAMRHLRRRKLIEDLNEQKRNEYVAARDYESESPYDKYPNRYVLSELGRAAVDAIKKSHT